LLHFLHGLAAPAADQTAAAFTLSCPAAIRSATRTSARLCLATSSPLRWKPAPPRAMPSARGPIATNPRVCVGPVCVVRQATLDRSRKLNGAGPVNGPCDL
jgi:hypothetical protein